MAEFIEFGSEPEKKKSKDNKVIKMLKKKPFLIAVIVVAIIALYTAKKKKDAELESGQNMVIPDNLEGVSVMYPGADTYGASDTQYVDDALSSMYAEMDKAITDMMNVNDKNYESFETYYSTQVDSMSEVLESFAEKIDSSTAILTEQSEQIEKLNDIQAMQNNSDAWHYAITDAKKKALEDANKNIARKWGWTFDDDSGLWYDGDTPVYITATQDAVSSDVYVPTSTPYVGGSSSSGSSSSASTKQSDINKMMANSDAWHSATESERKQLEEENKAIASKYGWSYNDTDGYWYEGNNKVYTTETQNKNSSGTKSGVYISGSSSSGKTISKEDAYNSGTKGSVVGGYYSGTLSGKTIV